MRIVREGWLWVAGAVVIGGALGWLCQWRGWGALSMAAYAGGLVAGAFMIYFFRDPVRVPPPGDGLIVAGADGWVRRVEYMPEDRHLRTNTVRISIFLSPFDVHVNRAPIGGQVRHLDYTPGRHVLTIRDAASEVNEHSTILIESDRLKCLVRQIVGPIVRRVVHWLRVGQSVARGESIGMMKFGSRLDIYLPAAQVEVTVKRGDRVFAGTSVVATVKGEDVT